MERYSEKTSNGKWWCQEDKNGAIFLRIYFPIKLKPSLVLTSNKYSERVAFKLIKELRK
jgi:hypothetical protein